jgi:hypothetical protein
MEMMGPFAIYPMAGALPIDTFPMPKEEFLVTYMSWIDSLKKGEIPSNFGCLNASMWTRSSDSLWLQELPGKRYMARPRVPFLQVQVHHMGFSLVDKVFRPMSLSQDGIFWGLQFSFPQIYEHPRDGIVETMQSEGAEMFQIVRKWSRDCTIATPILVDETRENLPIRIGKNCFSWVNRHPGLISKQLSVLEIIHSSC